MTYEDLRTQFGAEKICAVLGVGRTTESNWHSGKLIPPLKYLYMLKVRWPALDLNSTILAMCEKHNRYCISRGQPGLLD